MSQNLKEEFLQLFKDEAPDLDIEEQETRYVELISQFLVFGTTIGAFGGLWKVIELWVKRYANATVKIVYKNQDGKTVEIQYTNLTQKEVKNIENQLDIN